MGNPFDKIKKQAAQTKSKSQWKDVRRETDVHSRDCPQCGAVRPRDTDLRQCGYCGFTFMDIDAVIRSEPKVDKRK